MKIRNREFYDALNEELRAEWKSAFLECHSEDYLEEFLQHESSKTFHNFIDHSFTWADTSQGHSFWSDLANNVDLSFFAENKALEKKEKIKVYVVGNDREYFYWLKNSNKYNYTIEDDIYKSDLVIFTGGEDVHFSYYSKLEDIEYPHSHYNIGRDMEESMYYEIASSLGLKKLGICRGSQFLCVKAGGSLVQDMGHPSKHSILDRNNNTIKVTSSHHQAAIPPKDSSILGFTNICKTAWITDRNQPYPINVENVWYPSENSLGIQSHPEWQNYPDNKYFIELVDDFIADKGFFKDKNDLFTEEDALKILEAELV